MASMCLQNLYVSQTLDVSLGRSFLTLRLNPSWLLYSLQQWSKTDKGRVHCRATHPMILTGWAIFKAPRNPSMIMSHIHLREEQPQLRVLAGLTMIRVGALLSPAMVHLQAQAVCRMALLQTGSQLTVISKGL